MHSLTSTMRSGTLVVWCRLKNILLRSSYKPRNVEKLKNDFEKIDSYNVSSGGPASILYSNIVLQGVDKDIEIVEICLIIKKNVT